MIERRLLRQLERVAGRLRRRRTLSGWIAIWLSVATLAGLALVCNWYGGWYVPFAVPVLASASLLAALLIGVLARWSMRDYRCVAQRVEAAYPELRSSLLAAIDQRPGGPGGRFGFMQHCVIEDALRHAYRHAWVRVVPPRHLLVAHLGNFAAFACCVAALLCLRTWAEPPVFARGSTAADPLIRTHGDFDVTVVPGDTDVQRGTSLLVMARFRGALPPDARLVFSTVSGEEGELVMSKSLDDPVFGGRIPDVNEDLYYHVKYADRQTGEFRATVFEYPRLVRADAKLVFPEYTSQSERLVQDMRHVSAVEGTELTMICRLNKPVAQAWLIDRADQRLELSAGGDEPNVYTLTMQLERSRRFELRLVDAEGRENRQPPQFVINVLPNKPPDLKLVQPSRDVQVSPLEELQLRANAWDDYGINRLGVSFTIAGQQSQELTLGNAIPAKSRIDLAHLVPLEDLQAEPDQLLAYHFWAEDTASDGTTRRTSSDMFFAEVRHFEEIFRQGQQPPGGGQPQQAMQGNARDAQELAELQKQIINATWKIIRRETAAEPTGEFAEDIALVLDSQATALEQVSALAQRVQDPQSMQHIESVRKHMLEAIALLARAQKGPDLGSLPPALDSEQAAYQAMLKLRAREHQVMRSRQQNSPSSGRGGANSRSQQQLQQLDLKDDENRYETQRTAQSQEAQMDRENRQILNRLRELARRQNDLNERLKELQSALQEAQSEAEREEIRRQLKRLQEEQEQILRDTDELQSRMDQPQNQEAMSSERQQLEQTRQNVQQASEALQEGRVSRAVSSGTRAEREFEQLREEFRRRSANQFSEQMREMRQQAEQLDETEQELARELDQLTRPQPQRGSLGETNEREDLEESLRQQKQELSELLERMRSTVEEAESSEPLLAQQLYDAAREAMQQNLDQSLESAARSLRRGFLENAQEEERDARAGIGQLREGVERAAENVLGDETEALRRAREELEELTRQLEEELERHQRDSAADESAARDGDDETASGRSQRAEEESAMPEGSDRSAATPRQDARDAQRPSASSQGDARPAEAENSQPPAQDATPPGGRPQESQDAQQGGQSGRSPSDPSRNQRRARSALRDLTQRDGAAGIRDLPDAANLGTGTDPLTGDDFRQWSDRLRDVEEMVEDPELRAEVARIRDRAREFRQDVKRHSQEPNWNLVELTVVRPLVELRDRVIEELLRRAARDAPVPIDRDPVPPKYSEEVRRYYERLGSGS